SKELDSTLHQARQFIYIQHKEQRSQNTALRISTGYWSPMRTHSTHHHPHLTLTNKFRDPSEERLIYTIPFQLYHQSLMGHCIKGLLIIQVEHIQPISSVEGRSPFLEGLK